MATPHKVNPLTTAQIRVDPPQQQQQQQAADPVTENTIVPINKPEPGHDFFAEQPVQDAKSDASTTPADAAASPIIQIEVNRKINIGQTNEIANEASSTAGPGLEPNSETQPELKADELTTESVTQTQQQNTESVPAINTGVIEIEGDDVEIEKEIEAENAAHDSFAEEDDQ